MKNTKYYTELIGNMVETQCMSDLRNGETTIKDVPFEFFLLLFAFSESNFLRKNRG